MKVLDVFVTELPKFGGWPQGADVAVNGLMRGEVDFYKVNECIKSINLGKIIDYCGNYGAFIISKDDYESALTALTETAPQQVESLVWDGKGLPTMGVRCEWMDANTKNWFAVDVVYASEWLTVIREANDNDDLVEVAIENYGDEKRKNFRPIRAETDRRREAAVKAIMDVVHAGNGISSNLYETIAAGKIPGVKLCE